jgi:hypothetical protein
MSCARTPLQDERYGALRVHIYSILSPDHEMAIAAIYASVRRRFGDGTCQPDVICQDSRGATPEYQHCVRLALQDGKRGGDFVRVGHVLWMRDSELARPR